MSFKIMLPEELEETLRFAVNLNPDVFYCALETSLSSKLRSIAERRGVSAETLVNLWLQEKVNQEATKN